MEIYKRFSALSYMIWWEELLRRFFVLLDSGLHMSKNFIIFDPTDSCSVHNLFSVSNSWQDFTDQFCWLFQIDLNYAWTAWLTVMAKGDKCQWPEKFMTKSDGCNWWQHVYKYCILFQTGSLKALWSSSKMPKELQKIDALTINLQDFYNPIGFSYVCKLKAWYLPINVLFTV